MVLLSDSQRDAVRALGGEPVPVLDDQTKQVYYLISAEKLEQFRAPFTTDEPFEAREFYPLIAKTAAEAGWADSQMDDYDRIGESSAKP